MLRPLSIQSIEYVNDWMESFGTHNLSSKVSPLVYSSGPIQWSSPQSSPAIRYNQSRSHILPYKAWYRTFPVWNEPWKLSTLKIWCYVRILSGTSTCDTMVIPKDTFEIVMQKGTWKAGISHKPHYINLFPYIFILKQDVYVTCIITITIVLQKSAHGWSTI